MAGTCLTKEVARLKKIVFRATKGLALTYTKEIKTPIITFTGREEHKSVFIILYQENETFTRKLGLICDSFSGKQF